MNNKRKDHPNPKKTSKKEAPKKLQTHNISLIDVENTNGTN